MPESSQRMIPQHPRTGKTHDPTNPFPHFRSITMNPTVLAGSFFLSERTMIQTGVRIFQQLPTLPAQRAIPLFFPTIQTNHDLHNLFFPLYPNLFHKQFLFLFPYLFQQDRYLVVITKPNDAYPQTFHHHFLNRMMYFPYFINRIAIKIL